MTTYKATAELIAEPQTGLETVLSTLASSPKEAVYGLFNAEDKRCQIYQTSNFVSHVCKLVQEMGCLDHWQLRMDLSKVKLVILETEFRDKTHRSNKYRSLVHRYKEEGWTFYKDYNLAQYKMKEGYKRKGSDLYYVIELIGNKRRLVIGVFRKAKEAREWRAHHYPNRDIITEVVVADNESTKNW